MFRIPSDPRVSSDNPVVPSTTESGDDDATGTNNYGDVNEFNSLQVHQQPNLKSHSR